MSLQGQQRSGDDAGLRRLLDRINTLESSLRMVAAAAAGNQGQLDFLLNQLMSAEAVPGAVTPVVTDPATSDVPDTWLPFDPAADAQVTLTTSSTGRIAVQAGGYVATYSVAFAYARGFIGVEILDQLGAVVRSPASGDGNLSVEWGANNYRVNANAGHRHEWALAAGTTFTLRCRRGYSVGAGNAGSKAGTYFQGTALSVTKIGM